MRFSEKFKSSSHCLPSPDGRLVAILRPSGIHVFAMDSLYSAIDILELPGDLDVGKVMAFQWSLSSERLLVATPEQVVVVAAAAAAAAVAAETTVSSSKSADGGASKAATTTAPPFRAVIRNPGMSALGKPSYVGFGSTEDHVCVCSPLGIKLCVFDLRTAKTLEIANPKLSSSAAVCSRGLAFRPRTRHMALLTRTDGKDWVSVHHPATAATTAAWAPDTIDAHGLAWSPDGRWLAVWESPSHGHNVLFYTPDGHLFKSWTASAASAIAQRTNGGHVLPQDPGMPVSEDASALDIRLSPGVKLAQFSPDAHFLALGDADRSIHILAMQSIADAGRLVHPTTLTPQTQSSVKIWQEKITFLTSDALHTFVEAIQTVSPPGRDAQATSDAAAPLPGCCLLTFDSSSTLLATRLEEAPSTVWIWDVKQLSLRAVLMFHANVSSVVWHSTLCETLLITCEGDQHRGMGFVWNAGSGQPQAIDFAQYFCSPGPADGGSLSTPPSSKLRPTWLNVRGHPPTLFFSDMREFAFATTGEPSSDDDTFLSLPWQKPVHSSVSNSGDWTTGQERREESPLQLVPATIDVDDMSELEDTFCYKKDEFS